MATKQEGTEASGLLEHDEVMRFFDRYFAEVKSFPDEPVDHVGEFAKAHFPKLRLLDYGCGAGRLFGVWDRLNLEVIGIEPNIAGVQRARENPFGFVVIQNDGRTIPLEDGSVDIIACVSVLPHMADDLLPGIEAEFRRVLRPSGYLLVTGELGREKSEIPEDIHWGMQNPEKHRLFDEYQQLFRDSWEWVVANETGWRGWFLLRKKVA